MKLKVFSVIAIFLVSFGFLGATFTQPLMASEIHKETSSISSNDKGYYLIEGELYYNGEKIQNLERGKISVLSKLIRRGWNKVPSNVKRYIGGWIGVGRILDTIDHFTGGVEAAVYQGCRNVGFSPNVSWWITKGLLLAI